jgi:hypothetical protein
MMAHQLVLACSPVVGCGAWRIAAAGAYGALLLNDGWCRPTPCCICTRTHLEEESGLLERVAQIRDEAFGKRLRERLLPSQEVLAQRLFAQSQELAMCACTCSVTTNWSLRCKKPLRER